MGTWGTAIKDNDAFADIYSEFFELYNKGEKPQDVSRKLRADYWEVLEIEEEKHSYWFAFALAQWETKSLELDVLSMVKDIVSSGDDLKLWLDSGASEKEIAKRRVALDKFLQKIISDRPKAKARHRPKLMTAIFAKGDCLAFKMKNGRYGGAVVLAADPNPERANNLVATTRLNQPTKPTVSDFENAEVLVCNFGQWQDKPDVTWYMPDLYYKTYSSIYKLVGKVTVDLEYDQDNYDGKGYAFEPNWTSGWSMNFAAESQFDSETKKPKPTRIVTIRQLIKKGQK
jgi:hypothetical protein